MAINTSDWRMVDRNEILPTRKTVLFLATYASIEIIINSEKGCYKKRKGKNLATSRHFLATSRQFSPIIWRGNGGETS